MGSRFRIALLLAGGYPARFQGLSKSTNDLPLSPAALMAPPAEEGGGAALGVEDMPDDMQVCLRWWERGFILPTTYFNS